MIARPPEPSPGQTVSRRRILLRRTGAIVALLAAGVLAFGLVKVASRGDSPPPTTAPATIPPPKPLRIVFPEGFTRLDMAQRVRAVVQIAVHKRHVKPRLSERTYLAATQPRRIPGFGAKKRPLEGFLFPATYDFLKPTTSTQLVRELGQHIGGGGGGRPTLAEAGGRNPDGLRDALEAGKKAVAAALG